MDDGIKTLGLNFRATCRERSAAHFRYHLFWTFILLCIAVVSTFQENVLFAFSEPIEVKAGLLFENVLTEYTLTGSQRYRTT